MMEKIFGQFISKTRGVSCTRRGDEIELDGQLLSNAERDALPVGPYADDPDTVALLQSLGGVDPAVILAP